ncbi:hypothetical protein AiwAL_11570 [Acidiphilium sp. AL]|uniref:Uncharacterized protein n=1 Tax=Acidiphilium iwatense TaxID=768198 RepID=A0ABS9E4E4_9PROT|nr:MULTISPECIES: hypothetical protein [Acidiphilium]MCF3948522.1 hypothetical protein [Acidiphilium iwatense]MCU4160741.1 hypothetical protein [Acidiphilium sp. AL]
MTERLVKYRTPKKPPPSRLSDAFAAPDAPGAMRLAMLAGPAIGFALGAMLVVALALALAGGGAAAMTHTAIFVL